MYTAGKRAGGQTAAQLSDFTCKWKPHTAAPPVSVSEIGGGRENKKRGQALRELL